jgi:hypothetical protein
MHLIAMDQIVELYMPGVDYRVIEKKMSGIIKMTLHDIVNERSKLLGLMCIDG